MSRWRMLTVIGLVPLAIGCTHQTARDADFSPRPSVGLANAQGLYGSPPSNDQGPPRDVVSNGLESCGRYLENGVLRYQWPPCPAPQVGVSAPPASLQVGVSAPPTSLTQQLLPVATRATRSTLSASSAPWREKFFVEWPCSHKLLLEGEGLAVVACAVPEP
jgi:hypothetical protein